MSNCRTSGSQPQNESGTGEAELECGGIRTNVRVAVSDQCIVSERPGGGVGSRSNNAIAVAEMAAERQDVVSTVRIPLGSKMARSHFTMGDHMARPTGVACKPTLIRSTAGDGSGDRNASLAGSNSRFGFL
jgi:hypothetical protein